jgi:hypothetical protein
MQHVLTHYGKTLNTNLRRAPKICLSGFAEGLAHAAGFQAMRPKIAAAFSRLSAEN